MGEQFKLDMHFTFECVGQMPVFIGYWYLQARTKESVYSKLRPRKAGQ